jgi:hypothetical protein
MSAPARITRGPDAIRTVAVAVAVMAVLQGLRSALAGTAPSWTVARACGITAYLLLVALTAVGLWLAHPSSRTARRPGRALLLRAHLSLAVLTLTMVVLHAVLLALDPYAGVGWRGVLVPGASSYRSLPVTLGVLALYAGLLIGITARFAGRFGRLWLPVHRTASAVLGLVWMHAVLSGTDAHALRGLYLGTGVALLVLAALRHLGAAALPGQVRR